MIHSKLALRCTSFRVQFWGQILEPDTIFSPERAAIAADSQLRESMVTNLTGNVQRFVERGLGPPYDHALERTFQEACNSLVKMPLLLGTFREWLQKAPQFLDTLAASFDLVLHAETARLELGPRSAFTADQYLYWGLSLIRRILVLEDAEGSDPISRLATLPWLRRALTLAAVLLQKKDAPVSGFSDNLYQPVPQRHGRRRLGAGILEGPPGGSEGAEGGRGCRRDYWPAPTR